MKKDLKRVTELITFPIKKRDKNAVVDDDSASTGATEDDDTTVPKSLSAFNITFCRFVRRNSKTFGLWTPLISGMIFIALGVISMVWTPFQVLLNERLQMRPGLPPFNWWQTPPDTVYFRINIFNLTNSEEFLGGTDAKLRFEEIGPIVFKEELTHTNITFNENGTLSYIAKRIATFVPEMTKYDLDATLVLPNFAVLGIASYLWDMPFFTKFGFNLLVRTLQSEPVIKKTIRQVLWNFTDPILGLTNTIVPSLVPTENMGYLHRMYDNAEDVVTVFIGSENGHTKFFGIDKFDGSEYLPGYNPNECSDKLVNSTEGVTYHQLLTKDSVLLFWKKTICKVYALHYQREQAKYGVTGYKYVLPNNSFDRTYPSFSDCYISNPPLPNGLMDASKCHFDFPVAASFPHFLYANDELRNCVDGLNPKENLHESYALVEPTIGVPLESVARSQSNLVVRKLAGFNEIVNKFSDMVIPMFWAEFNQVGLPWHIAATVYIMVVLVPIGEIILTIILFLSGLYLISSSFRKFRARRRKVHSMQNKTMHFEQETEGSNKPLLVTDD